MMEQLTDAWNAHDAEQVAGLFAPDYVSAQPAHPARAFTGSAQVLDNWAAVFAGVPDFRATLVAHAVAGEDEWGEVAWSGNHVDGSAFEMRGVIVATVREGRIAAARLYVEPVEADGEAIEAAVDSLYRPPR